MSNGTQQTALTLDVHGAKRYIHHLPSALLLRIGCGGLSGEAGASTGGIIGARKLGEAEAKACKPPELMGRTDLPS